MVGTAVSNERCWAQLRENAYLMGQMVDADTAYMTSRGPAHPGRPPASTP
ncbi:cystathionine beta-lyase [Klebsiella michiganensis]|uniref:Cystathionine beta-lyase n=1 Tax=Klebsiella michiganensis TaxID=1134687 RepID=A0A7H4M602_9ENTR|nr:cystathionine beta-lyase [Klebsiella michiganensis]